jgi:hypothetical protein
LDKHIKSIYLHEVERQCVFALNAASEVNEALQQASNGDEVFRNLHSLLTHASNVSRLLWPANPPKKKGETKEKYASRRKSIMSRGRTLRQLVNVPDAGHPLQKRTLRDHIEHFDERLDDWQATSKRRNIVQDLIGPHNSITGIDDSDRMRAFDPSTKEFNFRGESYDLQKIVTAIAQVSAAAKAAQTTR